MGTMENPIDQQAIKQNDKNQYSYTDSRNINFNHQSPITYRRQSIPATAVALNVSSPSTEVSCEIVAVTLFKSPDTAGE